MKNLFKNQKFGQKWKKCKQKKMVKIENLVKN